MESRSAAGVPSHPGEKAAVRDLIPIVYEELRRLARHQLAGERSGQTLNTTGLVHELWLRLESTNAHYCPDRPQFFALCAQVMRHIVVDRARARLRAKRGGGARREALEHALNVAADRSAAVVALDDGLRSLSEIDARKARIVELRYFGGLSVAETAEVLDISAGTVQRDWTIAKMWLRRELSRSRGAEPE
jgi:RNA polymerase sigma factor (TIGR02999 family)